MDNVNAQLHKMMRMLADERAQGLATEERLCQAEAQIKAASRQKAATPRTHIPLMLAPLTRPLLLSPAALSLKNQRPSAGPAAHLPRIWSARLASTPSPTRNVSSTTPARPPLPFLS
ncbi:hypothetical protein PCANC_10554 [Puccinia coronata f. sp. avenae]|uniref:Uncharacterized protein n=1 Tax=Puccinia coronata f. sp. avenae TaxID=200324 RepID=A0A2N5VZE8_9BASI|nr:hypothetical protein PCANC_10554 [Puccinia coronata f. sp. avenae]